MTLEELAREMYEAMSTPKPAWDQLGGVTKSVWIERARAKLYEEFA